MAPITTAANLAHLFKLRRIGLDPVGVVATQGPSAFGSLRDTIAQGEGELAHAEAELALLREEIARVMTKLWIPRERQVLRSFYLLFHLATPAEKREHLHLLLLKNRVPGEGQTHHPGTH